MAGLILVFSGRKGDRIADLEERSDDIPQSGSGLRIADFGDQGKYPRLTADVVSRAGRTKDQVPGTMEYFPQTFVLIKKSFNFASH